MLFLLLPLSLFVVACDPTLPPLRGQIEIGEEPYAVFVGGGALNSDLYAVHPEGGTPIPITFTNVAETRPALSADGRRLAFLRGSSLEDSTPATVWVMNLRSGSERELQLPKGAGRPRQVAWERGGNAIIVATEEELYRLNPPPGRPEAEQLDDAERAVAESSLAVLLGDPVFTRVVPCENPRDLCLVAASGRSGLLANAVRDPVRWGPDSVGFFVGDRLQIRPLRRGRPRLLLMTDAPERPREATFFPGRPGRDQ
ncbi:MAG TPA: hypothetical protein VFU40_06830 [Gemmatimonadales bacterium]|nr:hypothetical protein [Gemmatimonadales bacterium]